MDSDSDSDAPLHQQPLSLQHLLRNARPHSIFSMYEHAINLIPEQAKFELFKGNCKFLNPHAHQLEAVDICTKYLFSSNPDEFEDMDKTVAMQAIYDAIDQDPDRNSSDDVETSTTHESADADTQPSEIAHVARVFPVPKSRSCKMSIPCGGGKTAIMILTAIVHGGNCLIVTNNVENALNILKTIVESTNVHLVVPVRLLRPTSHDKQFSPEPSAKVKGQVESEENALIDSMIIKEDVISDGDASRRHFLPNGGANGITIADVCCFKPLTNSSNARTTLRRLLFQSHWSLVQFDEADAVSTKDFRSAMINGVVLNFDDGDGRGNVKRHVPLRADHVVYLSGTWHRGLDDEGRRFLRDAGKMLYVRRSVDLEVHGLLAKVAIASIVCRDDDWSAPFTAGNAQLRGMSAEKCRVLELLISLHLFFNHKIMVFSRYISQVETLATLFPDAFVVHGTTIGRESLKNSFKVQTGVIWATTTIGDRGFDVPDVQVVINVANYGESPGQLFQRTARCLRLSHKLAWMYDLTSPTDQPWSGRCNPTEIISAPRYSILASEGYRDRIHVLESASIKGLVVAELGLGVDQIPSIAYDNPSVRANHVLSFYRSVICKDKAAFGESAASSDKKNRKKPKSKQVSSHARLRSVIAKGASASKLKAALDSFKASKPASSTSLSVCVSEPVESGSTAPSFMKVQKHRVNIQSILARSPHPAVACNDSEMPPDMLWKIVCDIQAEARVVLKKTDAARSVIRNQIRSSIESTSDDDDDEQGGGSVSLQDQCGFLFQGAQSSSSGVSHQG